VKRVAALALVALLAVTAACGGEEGSEETSDSTPAQETAAQEPGPEQPRGGTLRVGLLQWAEPDDFLAGSALDPQAEVDFTALELFRCCLLRTLLSYNGRPTAEGGAELRPDLASELPTVSTDGLTWTFRLKPGLPYAPPYEDTEIVAADVIRAVERTIRIGTLALDYRVIEGAESFAAGEADTISGLETPDDHTLLVHLTEPAGDLGQRFALATTAPIPPGAADGHDDYGPFLVASGPYMLENYEPGPAATLVRNPSWTPASDNLRAAYADRIELTVAADEDTAYGDVEAGRLDLVPDQPTPAAVAERYRADPALSERLIFVPRDVMIYTAMNLAQPPFDDVHVRRAANLVVDKSALVELFDPVPARVATHIAPDSLEDNLLLDYDPFATADSRGDLTAARAEMAASSYDTDGDGKCDRPACSGIRAIAIEIPAFQPPELVDLLRRDLARLGLDLEVERYPVDEAYAAVAAQTRPYGLLLNATWSKGFPNGSGWFTLAFDSDDPTANVSLVGTGPERLEDWGYPATSVPSVDREIAACIPLVGGAQTRCWAALDQLLMESVAPWIPYVFRDAALIVSGRVASISIDQFQTYPALDRIALEPGS
jgi:peptide/nickel transport system substrate-binding protein